MSSGSDTTIQRLLDLATKGDDSAFDLVIQRSAQRLQVLTSRMLRNYPRLRRWEETGDVFQTAVLRLHQSLTSVRPESVKDFLGLAATQIRRTLIDLSRRHFGPLGNAANHKTDPANSLPENVVDRSSTPEEPATLESWTNFHEAVGKLPENERNVFELVWYSGMPQAEIAELLGISIPTIKRRLRSARLLLAGEIQKFDEGTGHE